MAGGSEDHMRRPRLTRLGARAREWGNRGESQGASCASTAHTVNLEGRDVEHAVLEHLSKLLAEVLPAAAVRARVSARKSAVKWKGGDAVTLQHAKHGSSRTSPWPPSGSPPWQPDQMRHIRTLSSARCFPHMYHRRLRWQRLVGGRWRAVQPGSPSRQCRAQSSAS